MTDYKPGPRQAHTHLPECKHGVPANVYCPACEHCPHGTHISEICYECEKKPHDGSWHCPHGRGVTEDCDECNGEHKYASLRRVLDEAFDQAAIGKGKERHANDKPFDHQPIMEIVRMVGTAGHAYQIMKKVQEAQSMIERDEHDKAVHELRGAIVYAAAMILATEEKRDA